MTRFVAVDWSGAVSGSERRIVTAVADADGELLDLVTGRTREQTVRGIVELADEGPLVAGLDFAFSFPEWFFQHEGLADAPAAWAWARDRGDDVLRTCPSPFWGRPGSRKPPLAPEQLFRRAELDTAPIDGAAPKSVFQIGGAGAVGTGSLRGMPFLLELQHAGFCIWPFDDPITTRPLALEIYPRALTGPVVKSDRDARAAYLEGQPIVPPLRDEHALLAVESEDAFDAIVSAVAMARHGDELRGLTGTDDPVLRREGALWLPAARDQASA